MAESKTREKSNDAQDLWNQRMEPIPIKKYATDTADTEKILVFSETGAGKTTFYLNILKYLSSKGIPKKDMKMYIVYPDRPQGLVKLYGLIPKEYQDCIDVLPVGTYEQTIIATATAVEGLVNHFKETGKYGWIVFELIENYWTFSQDYFCREAYGQSLGEFFSQMRTIMSKDKAEKKTAYEAFSGPFGGPWPIIKFFHNFNWIDKVKRYPFNVVFTSELKQEENEDSIFKQLGYRPAGEKHTQHKVDTILYLSHKKVGNNYKFLMNPFKLTGYRVLYAPIEITDKNAYEEHKKALLSLEKRGYKVSKIEDLEKQADIKPPKPKEEKKVEPQKQEPKEKEEKTITSISKSEGEKKISKKELTEKPKEEPKKETKESEDVWEI